jgi:hypothetical protein
MLSPRCSSCLGSGRPWRRDREGVARFLSFPASTATMGLGLPRSPNRGLRLAANGSSC